MRIIFILFLITSLSANAQISGKEKKVVKAVDRNNAEAVELLKKVININSGSMNFEGVQEVGYVFKQEFEKLGFHTEWIDGEPFNRSGHLVASHDGSGDGKKILLIGHLDTVFEPDSPLQEYKMVNDSIMQGPGVVDMKGGDVMIVYALRALKEAGQLSKMRIKVVMTGDEEKSGSPLALARKDLVDAAEWADIAIGFENGDSNPATAVVSRRGSTGWELRVKGNPAHSSQVFTKKVGVGAVYEASRILVNFYEQLSKEENLTFNPGVILGGTSVDYKKSNDGGSAFGKSNVVAQDVVVRGDLRAVSLEQLERARSLMQQIVKNNYPGTSAEIIFNKGGYPPLSPSEGNNALLQVYDQISRDLGYGKVEAVNPRNAGAADVSFTAGYVSQAMDGLGLSGGKDHTVDEYGNLNMLPRLTKRAALLLYRLTK